MAVVFFGFWLPFPVSHESNELPLLGMISLCLYVIYYVPAIYKYVQSKIN